MDSTFALLYLPRLTGLLDQLITANADRLENFHHFIRNAEKKEKLPIKLKLSFLRSLARERANATSREEDGQLS